MVCPDAINRKKFNPEEILKKDEILELVKLKRENPKEYLRTLKDISEVLRDIADIVKVVNKNSDDIIKKNLEENNKNGHDINEQS